MQAIPRIEWIGPLAPRVLGAEQATRAAEALRTAPPPRPTPRVRAILAFILLSFLTLGLHAVPGIGSLHTRTVVATGIETPPIGAGDPEMQRMRSLAAGVVGVGVMASGASAQQAVQWRVEDGGNGHWYRLVISGAITWTDARTASEASGGYLVTPTSPQEEAFLLTISNRASHPAAWVTDFGGNAGGPWLGGFQPPDASPLQPWAWVSGVPWTWAGWAPGEPNGGFGTGEGITGMLGYANSNDYRGMADAGLSDFPPYPLNVSYVIEWSADCNNDGIVDYGQILSGQLADVNQNGVPDTCEADPCPGDITGNGVVDGVDLSLVLATWLTDGDQGKVNCDRNNDGIVDGQDLAIVLAGWGACP